MEPSDGLEGKKMYIFGGKTLEKRGVDHLWVFDTSSETFGV